MSYVLILTLIITVFMPLKSFSCSAFTYTKNGHIILSANSDACSTIEGLIIVNKRNVSKRGSDSGNSGKVASWISKYGSITFTYCCREIAQYGINEVGLVLSTVGLPGSKGPDPDERPPLDGNIWAQYLLDNCSTIEEVLAVESEIRIVNEKDQYLICDRNGNSLVVECIDGKIIYYHNQSLPIPVLTNKNYQECLSNYRNDFIPEEDFHISNQRFQFGSEILCETEGVGTDEIIDFSFDVLDTMSQHPCTQWNIVFDIRSLTIYFRTKSAYSIRSFSLEDFDFSCTGEMLELDINQNYSGNIREYFREYSRENNLALMRKAFQRFDIERTEEQLNQIIDFFDSFHCVK